MTNVNSPSIPAAAPSVPAADWNVQKGKLKAKYAMLTDEDLSYVDGKRDEMLNRVQLKIGKTKDELAAIIAAL